MQFPYYTITIVKLYHFHQYFTVFRAKRKAGECTGFNFLPSFWSSMHNPFL